MNYHENHEAEKLVKKSEIRDRFNISLGVVEWMIANNKLKYTRFGKKSIRVYASSVEAYLGENTFDVDGPRKTQPHRIRTGDFITFDGDESLFQVCKWKRNSKTTTRIELEVVLCNQ